jgi:hypothetical protein
VRLAYIGVAMERYKITHGELPGSLNDLMPEFMDALPIDPFGGGSFDYQISDDKYIVKSKGTFGPDESLLPSGKSSENTRKRLTFTGRTAIL